MKNLLTLLLLILSVNSYCQQTITVVPNSAFVPTGTNTANLDLSTFATNTQLNTTNSRVTTLESRAKGLSDSAKTADGKIINLQGSQSATNVSVTDLYSKYKADSTAIANINVIAAGIPASLTITGDMTVPTTLGHNADIWVNCSKCKVTLPAMPTGWHWKIHNKWTGTNGTVTIAFASGVSAVAWSILSIPRASRPLDITYILNQAEIH